MKENLKETRERLETAEEELLGEKSRLDVLSRNLTQAREREVSDCHPLLLLRIMCFPFLLEISQATPYRMPSGDSRHV